MAETAWVRPSISAWLRSTATARPESLAVTCTDAPGRLTFAQLAEAAARRAEELTMVGPGDRVGVVMHRSLETVPWLYAVWHRHATAVPLGPQLGRPQRQQRFGRVPVGAVIDTAARSPITVLDARERPHTPHRLDPEVPLIMFTSGSTGVPKPVQITHRNLRAAAAANAERVTGTADTVWFDPLPLEHMGGLLPIIRAPLYGMTTVIDAGFDADALTGRLQRSGATAVSLVPTMLRRWLAATDAVPASLDAVLVGGAATPPDLVQRARARGVPLYVTYGMTETTSQIATATPAMLAEDPTTVGPPVAGVTVEVPAAADADAAPGPLVVRGAVLSPGYLDGDRTGFTDGGFQTGDLAVMDARGWLTIVGRSDRRIVSGGETVDPGVTEDVLAAVPWVRTAWVGGLPDEEWGERVVAVVTTDAPPQLPELITRVSTALDPAHRPRSIYITDALPRTASGTVDAPAVRRFIADAQPAWHA
jgi:O-succinylbenzoic acid--CoA ligase